jgi:toxin ParE1/3/4
MPTVLRTPRAETDLREIVEYIAKDNLSAALAWLDATEALFQLLAAQPELGQLRQTNRFKRSRRHAHGNYVIYYRPKIEGVEIIRVLHGARDAGPLL